MTVLPTVRAFLDRRLAGVLRGWRGMPKLDATKEVDPRYFRYSTIAKHGWVLYVTRLTQAGRWFLWPTLLWAGYSGTSLDLQMYIPFCYALSMWGVALVAAWWFKPQAELKVHRAERIRAGMTLAIDAEVTPSGKRASTDWYLSAHRLPAALDATEPEGYPLAVRAPGEAQRVRLGLVASKRGAYRLPAWRVETDFPFGLLRAYRVFPDERPLLVYPRFRALSRMELPVGRRYQPGGVALASHIGDSMEYKGNREYREGDNVRNIDWRATARLGMPIVREYREEFFFRVGLILDTHVPALAPEARHDAFEQSVSLSAAVSDYLSRKDYLVDLFAAGPNLYHLMAGRSLAYLEQILDILACVESSPDEPFEILEPALAAHLEQLSTVICVFMDWDERRRSFVYGLAGQGSAVKVIIVRQGPCTLDPAGEGQALGEIVVLAPKEVELVEIL